MITSISEQVLPGAVIDRTHPLAVGLVGWWMFNEGTGSVIRDLSGNGLHATPVNVTQSRTSGWIGGVNGSGYVFDGVDDYATVPDNAVLNFTSSFTMSSWVYQNLTLVCGGTNNNAVTFGKITAGTNGYMTYIECTVNTWTFFCYGLTPTNASFNTGSNVNVWKHLVAVYDAAKQQMRTYVNGALTNTVSVTGSPSPSANQLQFSRYVTNPDYLPGRVSDFRLWRRALSDEEIRMVTARVSPIRTRRRPLYV